MNKYIDDINTAEDEFNDYNYSYSIKDESGEIIALCCTEEAAKRICDALNAALQSHEKD